MQKTAMTLSNSGYDVMIVGRMKPNSKPFSSPIFHIHRFDMRFHKGKLFYIEYQIRLFLFLLKNKYDILCAVDLDTILPNVLIGQWKNIPIVYDAHEYFTEVPEVVHRPWIQSIWKWVERYSIPQCATMYTVGNSIAELFQKEYGLSCEVIYNYPFERKLPTTILKEKFIVLYQGDLNEGRGVDKMIGAMKMLKDEGKIEFWVIGDGYERNYLEDIVREYALDDNVKFLGYIPPKDLPQYTAQASLGLNLLENKGLNHYYSLANKFFDYIQAGVPVLTMNFPEYRRINNQYHVAILLDDLEIDKISQAIQDIYRDEIKYQNLVKNTDIAGRFLTWEAQEDKLRSIYNDIQ